MRIVLAAALAAACIALLGAAPAFAARNAELSMMDDQALLGASFGQINKTIERMQALGADRVRVSAFWADIAPSPHSTTKPKNFNALNPDDPKYRWAPLDTVVAVAAAHRMKVLLSLSTPIPYWGSGRPELKNQVWAPNKAEFAAFAFAAATRYRPWADQFAILNEPNQGAWLQPQSSHGKAVSPHVYRAIVRNAYPAIKRAAPGAT